MEESVPGDTIWNAAPATESECWRCGLSVSSITNCCPHCSAALATGWTEPSTIRSNSTVDTSLNPLFITYALLLVIGLVHASLLRLTIDVQQGLDLELRHRVFTQVLIVEFIDTLIIAFALWKYGQAKPRAGLPTRRIRIIAWLGAIPLLGGLLALNFGYHAVLRSWLGVPLISDELMDRFDLIAFATICVQPAIVEELYCRRFALDTLREPAGIHTAVWITAIMFGFMHVAVLPSVPYLILLGACLAYMRLASGTILLPILLHFFHNLVVLLFDCSQA